MIIVCGWSMGDCIGCVHKRTKASEETKEFYEIIIVKNFCCSCDFCPFVSVGYSECFLIKRRGVSAYSSTLWSVRPANWIATGVRVESLERINLEMPALASGVSGATRRARLKTRLV